MKAVSLLHRIAEVLRSGPDRSAGQGASPTAARWRLRVELSDVQRDLDELTDEEAYVDTEIARSRAYAAKLDRDADAAEADGCHGIACRLRDERLETDAFLAELHEVREAVDAEKSRLSQLRGHLTNLLDESDMQAGALSAGQETGPKT